jgi:hypothetical protein
MQDPDTILTEDDIKAIQKARLEYLRGETVSLEEVKKELSVRVRRSAR